MAARSPDISPGPLWAALVCVVLWLVLQIITNTAFVLVYAAIYGGLDFGDPGSIEKQLAQLIQDMSPGAMSTMLVTQMAVVWAGTLAVVWVFVGAYLRQSGDAAGALKRMLRGPEIPSALGLRRPHGPALLRKGAPLIGIATLGVSMGVQFLIPGEHSAPHLEQMLHTPVGFAGLFVVAVIMAPLLEELFFRGYVYPAVRGSLRALMADSPISAKRIEANAVWGAIFFSSSIFAGVHILTYGFEMGFILPLLVMSLVMAWLRERTGSVWPAVWAHAAFNGTSLIAGGLELYIRNSETSVELGQALGFLLS